MRVTLIVFFSLLGNYTFAQADPPHSTDVESYQFTLFVNEKNDSLLATAEIKGKGTGYGNSLQLNFKNKDRYGKGMMVNWVRNNKGKNLPFTHKNDLITIPMPKQNFYDFNIIIGYVGIPTNGLIIGKNKFGDKTWYGDNWPNRAQYWLPCVDNPADKATFAWQVFAPKNYTVVANGIVANNCYYDLPLLEDVNKCSNFIQTEPIPTKVAVIGIAKLEKKCTAWKNSIQVCNYYYPQTFAEQPNKMDVAIDILTFFEKTIGKYPFQKLNNVQSTTMFGGMENANNIFYDEYAVDSKASMEALIAHEIAHQWFGNTVTEKDFSHLWLSEGFATFFTNYYLEKKYGVDTLEKRLAADRKKVTNFLAANKRPVVDTSKNYMGLLNANSYEKGGLFLQALRVKVGEATFIKIVQTYYEQYKYKNANTDNFKAVVESITQQDFTAFFKDWLYSTSLPK